MSAPNPAEALTSTVAAPAQAAPFPVVDLDRGERFHGLVEILFKHPFRLNGSLHDRARVRIPTGADIRAFSKFEGDTQARGDFVIGALTGLSEELLGAMAGVDVDAVDAQVSDFLSDAHGMSRRSSPTSA